MLNLTQLQIDAFVAHVQAGYKRTYGGQKPDYAEIVGWAGAMAYLLLLISTVWVGFRTALKRTPWQGYQIAALGAFIGEMAEGFVIDTDHWRHFYLILGIIWGLAAATRKAQRAPRLSTAPA